MQMLTLPSGMSLLAASGLVVSLFLPLPAHAEEVPLRCFPLYGSATMRIAEMVHAQKTDLNSAQHVERAAAAVGLVTAMECPKTPLIRSVDCAVEDVYRTAEAPTASKVATCLETVIGQTPFRR